MSQTLGTRMLPLQGSGIYGCGYSSNVVKTQRFWQTIPTAANNSSFIQVNGQQLRGATVEKNLRSVVIDKWFPLQTCERFFFVSPATGIASSVGGVSPTHRCAKKRTCSDRTKSRMPFRWLVSWSHDGSMYVNGRKKCQLQTGGTLGVYMGILMVNDGVYANIWLGVFVDGKSMYGRYANIGGFCWCWPCDTHDHGIHTDPPEIPRRSVSRHH